jgi:5-methylcytosine-specific restriction endonuclease McrA
MAIPSPLPAPDTKQLQELRISKEAKVIYALLYEHRNQPLTMIQIREHLVRELGDQEQMDRRRRELNKYFEIEKARLGRSVTYRLVGRKAPLESAALGISERLRAEVLRDARCNMCGRTPKDDRVKLQVDHRMPQAWGGTNELENLQALCEECNRGKKHYFATLRDQGPQIKRAARYDEPHRRIGEILKAFAPGEVRSDVIEMAAHSGQFQEDWQKRLRELRVLGWAIKWRKRKDEVGRVRVYWRVDHWEPWPRGNIRAEISRREKLRKPSG